MAKKVEEIAETPTPREEFQIDKKKYFVDELDDQGKYMISQIRDLEGKILGQQRDLDVNVLAKEGFVRLLKEKVESKDEEINDPDQS